MDLNRVEIIGRLAQDPKEIKLQSGLGLVTFAVATNHAYKNAKTKEKKEFVDFHDVLTWGNLAGICKKYLKKGKKVYLEGRLRNRTWEDKNKVKHYKTEVIASNLIMLDKATPQVEKQEEEVEIDSNQPF